jgi:hypothetical protein
MAACYCLVVQSPPLPAADAGLRDQWMPQTEHDPHLQQPVRIEIIGRAATAALKLLSEQTGVALGVALEGLETVGERKLTAIAQGFSLKAHALAVNRDPTLGLAGRR